MATLLCAVCCCTVCLQQGAVCAHSAPHCMRTDVFAAVWPGFQFLAGCLSDTPKSSAHIMTDLLALQILKKPNSSRLALNKTKRSALCCVCGRADFMFLCRENRLGRFYMLCNDTLGYCNIWVTFSATFFLPWHLLFYHCGPANQLMSRKFRDLYSRMVRLKG